MEALPIAQQIKIIKAAQLKIPVYRAPTEDYDIERPTKFDKHIHMETVQVNLVIGYLLRTVSYLSRELILTNKVCNKDLWKKLAEIKDVIQSQYHTQR